MKKIRGCYEEGKNVTLLGDEKLTRCPLIFVRDHLFAFNTLTGHWSMMQKGFLPEAGGTEDQQAQIMKALVVYERAVNEAKAELRKARQSERDGAPKGGRKGRERG